MREGKKNKIKKIISLVSIAEPQLCSSAYLTSGDLARINATLIQRRKLKFRKVKQLAQVCTFNKEATFTLFNSKDDSVFVNAASHS